MCIIFQVDNINQDFVGSSQVASFAPGGSTVTSVTFTVNDDDEPEIEETYMFSLSMIGTEHTVTVPNMATVIIQANDDAYGVFSITDVSKDHSASVLMSERQAHSLIRLLI